MIYFETLETADFCCEFYDKGAAIRTAWIATFGAHSVIEVEQLDDLELDPYEIETILRHSLTPDEIRFVCHRHTKPHETYYFVLAMLIRPCPIGLGEVLRYARHDIATKQSDPSDDNEYDDVAYRVQKAQINMMTDLIRRRKEAQ